MCLLLETIRYCNGLFDNLDLHVRRMNISRYEVYGNEIPALSLAGELEKFVADKILNKNSVYKIRVIYGKEIEKIEISPYKPPEINSLKTVYNDVIDYHLKYSDRSYIEKLKTFKENNDDILIIKQGFVTDTSFANILFFNGKRWITPHAPLLKGTRRLQLLQNETVATAEIRVADLKYFKKARLVNAMIRFEDEIDVKEIKLHEGKIWSNGSIK